MKACYLILSVVIFTLWQPAFGKAHNRFQYYHLAGHNLLPSNNVYFALKDHLGYLWIATDKGIAKYNGYTTKLLNLDTKLANEDVWYLYEDNQARIWLGTIANEVGFIKDDAYRKANLSNRQHSLQPSFFTRFNNGVAFTSTVEEHAHPKNVYLSYQNNLFTIASPFTYNAVLMLSQQGIYALQRDTIYALSLANKSVSTRYICRATYHYDSTTLSEHNFFNYCFGKYFITERTGTLYVVNLVGKQRHTYKFDRDNERLQNMYPVGHLLYLISNYSIYTIDTNGTVRRKNLQNIAANENGAPHNISFFKDASYWGNLVAFHNNGLQIGYNLHHFKNADSLSMLADSRFVGRSYNGSAYWYSAQSKRLARLNANSITYTHIPHNVINITPVSDSISLMLTDSSEYWITDAANARTEHCYRNYRIHTSRFHESKNSFIETPNHIYTRRKNISAKYANVGYYLLNKANGFGHVRRFGDSIQYNNYSSDRHNGFAYDGLRGLSWLYNLTQIKVFKDSNLVATVQPALINHFGSGNIRQIEVHPQTGNVFILGSRTLHVYNVLLNRLQRLLPRQNLTECRIEIASDKLVCFGPPGIFACNILSPLKFSQPYALHNTKGLAYTTILSAQVDSNSILLNTDKGMLIADISNINLQRLPEASNISAYKFIVKTGSGIRQLKYADTLKLPPGVTGLPVDVINPSGSGTLRITAVVNNSNQADLENYTLNLANLQPGFFHTVTLSASDDAWQSKPIKLTIYIEAYWWQSVWGKRLIFAGILAALLLLLLLAIYLTKRIIDRRNTERRKVLEMNNLRLNTELKSLYAQINPHFIFNTLSTGLYFIKKKRTDEAYQHITAFSDLLRGYLKSSRNKFISIADEVTNLTNYIQLQQARFEDRFDFNIAIDNNINIYTTNIPSLLMQPLVENAINHGLLHKAGKGNLNIHFGLQGNILRCTIDDDGVGREQAKLIKAEQAYDTVSYGTDLIKELIQALNTYERMDISLKYIDKQVPQTGTTVIITITHSFA